LSGARISTLNGDGSWFESGISFAWDKEYIMASLALVHYAKSTGSESSLLELTKKNVDISPGYTGQNGDFVPPITWTTTDQAAVKKVKDLRVVSAPWNTKGSTAPVIHVGMYNYSIYTTAKALNKWCCRMCASAGNKKVAPLLAPSWDSKSKKLRVTLMLRRLARHILIEFRTMYAQLKLLSTTSQWRPSPGLPHQVRAEEEECGTCRRERRPHRPQR